MRFFNLYMHILYALPMHGTKKLYSFCMIWSLVCSNNHIRENSHIIRAECTPARQKYSRLLISPAHPPHLTANMTLLTHTELYSRNILFWEVLNMVLQQAIFQKLKHGSMMLAAARSCGQFPGNAKLLKYIPCQLLQIKASVKCINVMKVHFDW